LTPGATAQLWRYLLDIDWIETVAADILPLDHPLCHLLGEPRRMNFRPYGGIWARLVDVPAALSARSYGPGGALVIEVLDSFCPWNEGRFKLEGGVASRTEEEADLRCDVAALGSVYLGGFGFSELFDAGRVEELNPGALGR